jgi:hypothetical protein
MILRAKAEPDGSNMAAAGLFGRRSVIGPVKVILASL